LAVRPKPIFRLHCRLVAELCADLPGLGKLALAIADHRADDSESTADVDRLSFGPARRNWMMDWLQLHQIGVCERRSMVMTTAEARKTSVR
jgi:hypothetical protein